MKIRELKGLKLAKFILMIVSLAFLSVAAIFGIIAIFGVQFGSWFLPLIISILAIALGCFFAINSINMLSKNKILGWISLALISVAVLLTLLQTTFSIDNDIYVHFLISFALLSVLFNLLVSIALELGKRYYVFQIITYILLAILDFVATLVIFDTIPKGNGMGTKIFVSFAIVAVVLIVTLKILAKVGKNDNKNIQHSETVTISKEEYELLKAKAEKLDKIEKENTK
ncbi:MAG: hypothetical protein ACI4R8_02790 [Candidatus Caccovivens sp.]